MRSTAILTGLYLLLFTTATAQQRFTAYVFVAEECPVCNYLARTLGRLSEKYADEVMFVAVFPQRMSNYKTAALFKEKYNLSQFTIKIDHDRVLTDKYDATVTPEVIVAGDDGTIVYKGRINDSYAAPGRMRHGKVTEDLELAIKQMIVNQQVPKPWPSPIGCYITKR